MSQLATVLSRVDQLALLQLHIHARLDFRGTLAAAISAQNAAIWRNRTAIAGPPKAQAPVALLGIDEEGFVKQTNLFDDAPRQQHEHARDDVDITFAARLPP